MLKKLLSAVVIVLSVAVLPMAYADAASLPDFTVLAEKQGPAVVNISITQVTKRSAMQFPNMPYDENLQEFFKRFGIPGMPGAPNQGEQ